MKIKHALPVLLYAVIIVPCDYAQNSSLVFPGADGRLEYALYANRAQSNSINQVPDFSFAGYQGGGVALPYVEVKETIGPSSGDAGAMIQAAIDRVSLLPLDASGFRGSFYRFPQPWLKNSGEWIWHGKTQADFGCRKL